MWCVWCVFALVRKCVRVSISVYVLCVYVCVCECAHVCKTFNVCVCVCVRVCVCVANTNKHIAFAVEATDATNKVETEADTFKRGPSPEAEKDAVNREMSDLRQRGLFILNKMDN